MTEGLSYYIQRNLRESLSEVIKRAVNEALREFTENKKLDSLITLEYKDISSINRLVELLENKINNFLKTTPDKVYCGIAQYDPEDEKDGIRDRLLDHERRGGYRRTPVYALRLNNAESVKALETAMGENYDGINHRYTDCQENEGKGNENTKIIYMFERGQAYMGPKPKNK